MRLDAVAVAIVGERGVVVRAVVGAQASDLIKSAALQRLAQPSDLVGACLFLLSDEASYITAQVINVDGGLIFRP